jgi:hypothetical protein
MRAEDMGEAKTYRPKRPPPPADPYAEELPEEKGTTGAARG